MRHLTREELEAGTDLVRASPADQGMLELIVRRPRVLEREVVESAELDVERGLIGDNWRVRGYRRSPDGSAHPDMQVTVTNVRAVQLVAGSRDRWPLAGDQLYVDLDLSGVNLPPGTRLEIGSATLEVTAEPHNGCTKFADRYGSAAWRWVNSPDGKALHLRGVNTRVVEGGTVRQGDVVGVVRTS